MPKALRQLSGSKSWKVPYRVEKGADGSRWFTVKDPEGNKVQFVQLPENIKPIIDPSSHWPPYHSCRISGA